MIKVLSVAAALFWACTGFAADEVSACFKAADGSTQTIAHCTAASELKDIPDERRAAMLTQRGLARAATGDFDRAREDFDASIRLNGESAWAYNARAVVWMQKGDVERAISDYEHAVHFKPDYAFAWANLGAARLVKGDADGALRDLDEALRRAPPRVELALTSRGKAWLAKGDFDRALADFDGAVKVNPKYANAISGRAYARFCQGDFEGAAADFRSARSIRMDAESAVDLIIAVRRSGRDGRAETAAMVKEFSTGQGVPPGLALFGGEITPQQALQASEDRDPKIKRLRLCASSFEVGEWYVLQRDWTLARQYLQMARDTCDPSQRGFAAAGAELARMK
jgi:tetratricopeptide (TPR) repeat protein